MTEQEPNTSRYVVGIDLGTTNSAVAFIDSGQLAWHAAVFRVPQLVAPGEIEARETLPSFHFEPPQSDHLNLRLPWHESDPATAVGVYARDAGAAAPGRLIVSAKSWLSHSGVDRTAALLPWHGAADAKKLSPSDASARYLGHIREAWNAAYPEHPLEDQDVVVTIPASFDEVARELTVAAARTAGLRRIVVLEEPQAAFYAWVHARNEDWTENLRPGQRILVCDVGGGTSDFTLIQVRPGTDREVKFHRFAVGDHLILGGDNLDLALAHHVEKRIGKELSPRQWSVLVRRCQKAKEAFLGPDSPETLTLNVAVEGKRLVGGALQVELTRDEVLDVLVEGFLPRVPLDARPVRRASGFQEFGLPYAADAAITRYLAAFLSDHRETVPAAGDHDPARPDILLFNGGMFESGIVRDRLLEVLRSWFPEGEWSPHILQNERLDLAVALGAAYYGMVRRGHGVRISGGLARSYYVGVSDAEGNEQALCLVPAGLEEGQSVDLSARTFDLVVKEPAEFPLYVSSSRTTDQPGDLVEPDPTQFTPLPPIRTVLRVKGDAKSVRVRLHAALSEIGTLELWCGEADGKRRWKLQFDVRAASRTELTAHEGEGERAGFLDEDTLTECAGTITAAFESLDKSAPEQLVKNLEKETGMTRLEWPPSLLRSFWEVMLPLEKVRQRSPIHEARWLNFLGFSLRPGFGFAVDDWRVAQTWRLASQKPTHENNELCRAEWWILWRRIAAGLTAGQQMALADPLIAKIRKDHAKPHARGITSTRHEAAEVWRLLGSLEQLPHTTKTELGDILLAELKRRGLGSWSGAGVWALGRLGARVPMHGALNSVLPAEKAEEWTAGLLSAGEASRELPFAVMQMVRRTGDRFRDVSEALRGRAVRWLEHSTAPAHYAQLVRDGGELAEEEQGVVFGEALPRGLRLG